MANSSSARTCTTPLSLNRVDSTEISNRRWSLWAVISTRFCSNGCMRGLVLEEGATGSAALKHQIPHTVAQADATVFELGQRPVVGLGGIALGRVGQQGFRTQHLQHLHRIGLPVGGAVDVAAGTDRKSTRLNSSHLVISYAVFCLKKKNTAAWVHPRVNHHIVA